MRIPRVYSDISTSDDKIIMKRFKDVDPFERIFLDITNEKSKVTFVKYVERIIRGSMEYKEFIKTLKHDFNLNECAYFKQISTKIKNISIEIHHEPFSLYDLVFIVLKKKIDMEERINPYEIAEEVMYLHYEAKVGLIPLSKTVHQLVHNFKIFIPIDNLYGERISNFYEEYCDYMTDDQKSILYKSIELSKKLKVIPDILKVRYLYIDHDGFVLPDFKKLVSYEG